MIQEILKIFDDGIVNLAWSERYGGLTVPVTIEDKNEYGAIRKRFPISCNITARQCYEQERYLDLVPDDKFKSVIYWEQQGDTRIEPVRDVRNKWQFSANVNLVCWLNMPRLGFDGCTDAAKFIGDAFRVVMSNKQDKITDPYLITGINIVPTGQTQQGQSVFRGYSYEDREAAMLYPYAAFSIQFRVTWMAAMECFFAVELNDPILCETIGSVPSVPFECPDVQIFDGNGDLIATVPSGGEFTFQEASSVQVLINGQLWDNLIANEDIPVVNSDNDPLGSKVGNQWLIPDTDIEIYTDGDLQFSGSVATLGTDTININLT